MYTYAIIWHWRCDGVNAICIYTCAGTSTGNIRVEWIIISVILDFPCIFLNMIVNITIYLSRYVFPHLDARRRLKLIRYLHIYHPFCSKHNTKILFLLTLPLCRGKRMIKSIIIINININIVSAGANAGKFGRGFL